MKQFYFPFMLMIIASVAYSQKLEKYSGEYPNEYGTKGFATYTYYEDSKTGDYVKHGTFKYTMKENNNYSAVFSGNFKNGKREGIWTYNITRLDDPEDKVYYTGTIQMTSNYSNGLPTGTWTYSKSMKYRRKVPVLGGFNWTAYEMQPPVSATATFKDGMLVGTMRIANDLGRVLITGDFNKDGFMDKTWTFKENRTEQKMMFNNGILTSNIVRGVADGKVIERDVDDEETTALKNDFLLKKISTADLLKKRIIVDTMSAVRNNLFSFTFTFYNNVFNYENIEGDETYFDGKNVRNDSYYILFRKQKLMSLEDISDYKQVKSWRLGNESDYKQAIENYENIIDRYRLSLSDEDIETLTKEIENLKEETNKQKVEDEKRNIRRNEYKAATNELKNGEYQKALDLFSLFQDKWKGDMNEEERHELESEITECKTQIAIKRNRLTAESLENLILIKQDTLNKIYKGISTDNNSIWKYIYFVFSDFEARGTRGIEYTAERNGLVNIKEVNNENKTWSQLDNEKLENKIAILDVIVRLQTKIILLNNNKTKKLEQAVYSANTQEEIRDLILNFSINK